MLGCTIAMRTGMNVEEEDVILDRARHVLMMSSPFRGISCRCDCVRWTLLVKCGGVVPWGCLSSPSKMVRPGCWEDQRQSHCFQDLNTWFLARFMLHGATASCPWPVDRKTIDSERSSVVCH
jgi:hypothetical protein